MARASEKDEAMRFDDNPPHAGVTKDTASTPGYFRLLLPGLAGRYILRWSTNAAPDILQDIGSLGVRPKTSSEASEIIGQVEQIALQATDGLKDIGAGGGQQQRYQAKESLFKGLFEGQDAVAVEERLKRQGISKDSMEKAIVSRAFEEVKQINGTDFDGVFLHRSNWQDFCKDVKKKIAGNQTMRGYDNVLGTGSMLLTGYYANRVASDMKKVFAETVAYEFDKDPKDITYRDLWNSENRLVEEVRSNFIRKNLSRVGTDALFFLGNLAHVPKMGWVNKYSFSDLGVGVKGVQLMGEVISKHTTIFEELVQLIDNKMNPLKGMGAPITVADTFDLYQKYTQMHDPQASFRDALSSQSNDGRDWMKAQTIFKRVSELMNLTYKYKHIGPQPSESDQAKADFALPKFLYLLGNGLIDTYKPEETLAYIEVANAYGIPAVRQLQRALERGIPVDQALSGYPEELRQSILDLRSGAESAEKKSPALVPAKEQDNAPGVPANQVHAVAEVLPLRPAPSYQLGV